MAKKVIAAAGGSVRGKTVGILGLTFKPNTDDMRDSPSLAVILALQDAGATIRAYDPEGVEQAKTMITGIEYAANPYDAITGADVAVLITEWDAFRALDLDRVRDLMASPVMVDLRNVYNPADMAKHGIAYSSIGR
jgi:UDPglucose 6-dehydrogenase